MQSDYAYWLALSRPNGIVSRDEDSRIPEFVQLYREQMAVLVGSREPTIVERVTCRRICAVIWEYDRTTTRSAAKKPQQPSIELQWSEQFRESEVRRRLNELALDEIGDARRFAAEAGGALVVVSGTDNREEVA